VGCGVWGSWFEFGEWGGGEGVEGVVFRRVWGGGEKNRSDGPLFHRFFAWGLQGRAYVRSSCLEYLASSSKTKRKKKKKTTKHLSLKRNPGVKKGEEPGTLSPVPHHSNAPSSVRKGGLPDRVCKRRSTQEKKIKKSGRGRATRLSRGIPGSCFRKKGRAGGEGKCCRDCTSVD